MHHIEFSDLKVALGFSSTFGKYERCGLCSTESFRQYCSPDFSPNVTLGWKTKQKENKSFLNPGTCLDSVQLQEEVKYSGLCKHTIFHIFISRCESSASVLFRDGNRELVLVKNWFPVVYFLQIVSLPAYRPCLSVLALLLHSADLVYV